MVLEACSDIVDYAKEGITSWRDLVATAANKEMEMIEDQP
jgi:replication initiation protein RepC